MEQKDYRLAAIMFTDIAGFSRMMEKDESGTLELLHYHNELIAGIAASHHGSVIKTIGDALLVDFKNTVEALQSALEIQDRLYAHNKASGKLPLLVRIGLHLGDIYFFENDALGEGINIAARLQSLARPGCIVFSQDVYNLVLNKIEFRAEKLGKVSLKNITKEIHAYEITTPNVELDPNRGKPRPGYEPGSYLGPAEPSPSVGDTVASTRGSASQAGPAWASPPPLPPAAPPPAGGPPADHAAASPIGREADRSYSEEGSRSLLTEIRKAILEDIKKAGRRITVEEARERYGFYGVEAQEVIAAMTEQGLLQRASHAGLRFERPEKGWGFVMHNAEPSEAGASASTDIGKTIEAAVHGIVTEIERSVERNMTPGQGSDYAKAALERVNQKIAAKGERYRERMEARRERWEARAERHGGRGEGFGDDLETGKWDRELDKEKDWKDAPERTARDFASYRDSILRKARSARGGFVGNLASWLGVCGFLAFGNFALGWGGVPWAGIVAIAWGIGVASSAAAAWRGGVKAREIENLPELDREQLGILKNLNRVKDSIVQHGSSTITVTALLAFINLRIADPSFLWFLIPGAALGISFLSHLLAYRLSKPRLEAAFKKSLGVTGGWKKVFSSHREARSAADSMGPYAELWREAERNRAAILAQTAGKDRGFDDLAPTLGDYVGQVKLLAVSANEIDRLVDSIPMPALRSDKASLLAKEAAASPSMKAEYRKSIDEIERQEKSWEELGNQREVVRLRLSSAVNQLKQTRIDMARIRAAGDAGEASEGYDKLRARTKELTSYLEDLRKGYDESRRDPFAELEEAERRNAEVEEAKKKSLEGPPSA